jgi:predicted RNase H-related nuclease YkuK (DUF458 family)
MIGDMVSVDTSVEKKTIQVHNKQLLLLLGCKIQLLKRKTQFLVVIIMVKYMISFRVFDFDISITATLFLCFHS